MPIDPEVGRQLADLGGFALLLLFSLVMGVGFVRRWWVFGWLFDERTAERDAARAEVMGWPADVPVTQHGLREAIPPVYTHWIGRQFE